MKTKLHSSRLGGALIIAVLTMAVLAATAATVLSYVSSKYRNLSQATSWRKALVAAESGIDFTVQKLTDSAAGTSGVWTGWSTTDPATGATLPYSGKCFTATALTHAGDGGNYMNYYVIVDSPPGLASASKTKQYYRIRSTGYSDLAGAGVVTNSALDVNLRKLSLRFDRETGLAVAKPRASRTIEVVVAPETEIKSRNTAHIKWDMDKKKTEVRAFDSTSTAYSTGGKWDPDKQVPADEAGVLLDVNQWHKDYEKKGTVEKVDLEHSTIWGDFAAFVGPIKKGANIKGQTLFDSYTELPKVPKPIWASLTDPSLTKYEGDLTAAQKTAFTAWKATASTYMKDALQDSAESLVLRGSSTESNPTTYKVTKLKMEGEKKSLVLANPSGASESWIEIWVTEEFKVKGKGALAIENGVHATIHFQKRLEVKDTKKDGGGTFVESGFSGDLRFYGIEMDDDEKEIDADFSAVKRSGEVKIKEAQFAGVVYAPDYDMELKSRDPGLPKSQQYILGAVTGRKIKFKGDTDFVTDLALSQSGKTVTGYKVASWFEDSE